jgi:hypothetical protein
MAVLDFKEIPTAQAGVDRDQFELFAREFLVQEGFVIVSGPDRGSDAGRDMIAVETRTGPGGDTTVRWLVSCKHKAHTGASVTSGDELNLRDRIETHECTGFIAFYSTLPSSGLATHLHALQPKFGLLIYDAEHVERKLLDTPRGRTLAVRFMPASFSIWVRQSQYAVTQPAADPQLICNTFFLREPHSNLADGLKEAAARGLLAFVVIFDPAHPQHSQLNYALGCFMGYQTTKRLVDEYFVPIVGPSADPQLSALVPEDEPLELCLWVVLNPAGQVLRREGVYANSDEGMKRVREVIRENTHPDG